MTKCPFCKGTGDISEKFKKMPEPCFCGGEVYAKEASILDAQGRESTEVKSVFFLCAECGIRGAMTMPIINKPEDYAFMYRGHSPKAWKVREVK